MCTDEKRTCDTAFVCATKVLCSLSAENLPKKSVCVFRRRHSPTEEEEEEKEEEKEERRNARRKRAAAAFNGDGDKGGKRRLRGERERGSLCNATFVNELIYYDVSIFLVFKCSSLRRLLERNIHFSLAFFSPHIYLQTT